MKRRGEQGSKRIQSLYTRLQREEEVEYCPCCDEDEAACPCAIADASWTTGVPGEWAHGTVCVTHEREVA